MHAAPQHPDPVERSLAHQRLFTHGLEATHVVRNPFPPADRPGSIRAFSNDGKLDASERDAMAAIARKNGTIDADKARVLLGIIDKLTDAEVTPEMKAAVADLRGELPATTHT